VYVWNWPYIHGADGMINSIYLQAFFLSFSSHAFAAVHGEWWAGQVLIQEHSMCG
jgi:hypothetical protein